MLITTLRVNCTSMPAAAAVSGPQHRFLITVQHSILQLQPGPRVGHKTNTARGLGRRMRHLIPIFIFILRLGFITFLLLIISYYVSYYIHPSLAPLEGEPKNILNSLNNLTRSMPGKLDNRFDIIEIEEKMEHVELLGLWMWKLGLRTSLLRYWAALRLSDKISAFSWLHTTATSLAEKPV